MKMIIRKSISLSLIDDYAPYRPTSLNTSSNQLVTQILQSSVLLFQIKMNMNPPPPSQQIQNPTSIPY